MPILHMIIHISGIICRTLIHMHLIILYLYHYEKAKIFLLINNFLLLHPKYPLERKNLCRIMEYVEFMWRICCSSIPSDTHLSLLVEARPQDSGGSDQISLVVCFAALPFGAIMLFFVVRYYRSSNLKSSICVHT